MGLWWWLLGFTDRFRGFVVVVAVGFKVVYEIVGFVRAVGCRRGCGLLAWVWTVWWLLVNLLGNV